MGSALEQTQVLILQAIKSKSLKLQLVSPDYNELVHFYKDDIWVIGNISGLLPGDLFQVINGDSISLYWKSTGLLFSKGFYYEYLDKNDIPYDSLESYKIATNDFFVNALSSGGGGDIEETNHAGQIINPDSILLNKEYTNLEAEELEVGSLFYNSDLLCWVLKLSDVNYYNFGEELLVLSRIGDNQNHLEGQACYITGGQNQMNNVSLTSSIIGRIDCLATLDVLNTGSKRGYYCYFGQVHSFPYSNVIKSTDDPDTWVDGADLYLCNEPGRYSTTKEPAPSKASYIGKITNRSGDNITVMFAPLRAITVEDLNDVDGDDTTVGNTDVFLKKDTGGLWKKITWANIKTLLGSVFESLSNKKTTLTDSDTDYPTTRAVNTGLAGKQTKTLYFSNKTVLTTDFVADTTYAGYGYKAVISCAGVTSTMLSEVTFAPTEADSGNYAAVCLSGAGTVTIYAKAVPSGTITIPIIKAETTQSSNGIGFTNSTSNKLSTKKYIANYYYDSATETETFNIFNQNDIDFINVTFDLQEILDNVATYEINNLTPENTIIMFSKYKDEPQGDYGINIMNDIIEILFPINRWCGIQIIVKNNL